MIELLKAEGLSPTQAVTFGSMLGVIQVSARGLDFLGGGRWDGITTALIATATLVLAILLLMIGGGSHWMIAAFILLYGLGSGALAVARATIPLVFYDNVEFAKATSRIALPLNLISRSLAANSRWPAVEFRQQRPAWFRHAMCERCSL